MNIKCLIDHAEVVYAGMIFEVLERHGNQVRIEGLDGYPVWLSEDYRGVKEFEIIEELQ